MKFFKKIPVITQRLHVIKEKKSVWLAREHRKGLDFEASLLHAYQLSFWKTQTYNRYIGISFAVGAFLFGLASILVFCTIQWPGLNNLANVTFFAGSIPFTLAAALQHFQSANMEPSDYNRQNVVKTSQIQFIGWYPRNTGWWSTFTQLLGTIAFNVSTFNSIAAPTQSSLSFLEIWAPNFEGSVLFLISGYLALIEVANKYWSWQPKRLSWQIVFINLLGCVAFMIAAVTPSSPEQNKFDWIWLYSNTYTLIGAICFFAGASLLVFESDKAPQE